MGVFARCFWGALGVFTAAGAVTGTVVVVREVYDRVTSDDEE